MFTPHTVRMIHRTTAILLGVFILAHLGVHLTAIAGPEAHDRALRLMQLAYRNPIGESMLVAVILIQVVTGISRLRFRHLKGWALAQVISGLVLMIFLIFHTGAALYTHHIFGLESDFFWAAGSLHYPELRYGFAIYYFAAILAFFTHLGAAVRFGWPQSPPVLRLALPGLGALVGAAILIAFSGLLYPIEIGPDVAAYYRSTFGFLGVGD